ncbi:hypothetical protein L7F22_039887 [Adiantum nelumboides]|nr:hypothetical protein [Adiantum nelumboides]
MAAVHRPREQIEDVETLMELTESFVKSLKDACHGGAAKAADFVCKIIETFRLSAGIDHNGLLSMDWAALGHEAISVFDDAQLGINTMLGPMDTEPKRRKVAASKRRERGPIAATAPCPRTCGHEEGDQEQVNTDRNIQTMLHILRQCGERGCELENLILSRESFAHTVENIFFLSFLVKDGCAQISVENQKQTVAFRHSPTANSAGSSARPEGGGPGHHQKVVNTQFVFRFDFRDWAVSSPLHI